MGKYDAQFMLRNTDIDHELYMYSSGMPVEAKTKNPKHQ